MTKTDSASPTMTSRRPEGSGRIGIRVLGSAVSLMVLVVALELGLRLAGWATLTLRARQAGGDASQRPGIVRMLHLGESTTFGLGVKREEAYPAIVAEDLRTRHPGHEFVSTNRGVPGLVTSAMERTLNEKLTLIHPRLVTIMAGANDFNEELNGLASQDRFLPQRVAGLLSSLRIYKTLWLGFQLMRPSVRLEQGEVIYYHHGGSKNILYETPRDEQRIAEVTFQLEDNLRRMIGAARKAGSIVLLVGYIQAIEENKILMRVANETAVPYVSTYLEPEARRRDLFVADGWHPSALGHRYIADRIAAVVDPLITKALPLPSRDDVQTDGRNLRQHTGGGQQQLPKRESESTRRGTAGMPSHGTSPTRRLRPAVAFANHDFQRP
jgi:lysophospholipase L1-like esterase